MPRAYCPDCGAEVPVDAEGRCHVGHEVDLASREGDGDLAEAARAVEAGVGADTTDESGAADGADDSGGGTPDGPRWLLDADLWGDDDEEPAVFTSEASDVDPDELEPAERPEAVPPDESDGWQPPLESPVGPGPVPPPEPAAPPPPPDETDDAEAGSEDTFADLDDWLTAPLAAAAAESRAAEAETSAAASDGPSATETEDEQDQAPEQPADDDRDGAQVDLTSFTARGEKVGKRDGRKSLFRLGR